MTKTELKIELGKIYCFLNIIRDPNPVVSGAVADAKECVKKILTNYDFKDAT